MREGREDGVRGQSEGRGSEGRMGGGKHVRKAGREGGERYRAAGGQGGGGGEGRRSWRSPGQAEKPLGRKGVRGGFFLSALGLDFVPLRSDSLFRFFSLLSLSILRGLFKRL